MMEINKKELRKLSRSFRSSGNRVLNAHYDEIDSILRMFIEFIDSSDLIYQFISNINVEIPKGIGDDIKEVQNGYGRIILSTGSNADEEIVYTYNILKYFVNHEIPIWTVARAYTTSAKFQDIVKAFGTRVILPFINHIELYMTNISIDMGYDEDTNYILTVNGGQVNIAKDSATIHATQNNLVDIDELNQLIEAVRSKMDIDIGGAERELIDDNLEVLQEELKREEPRRGFIKTAVSSLQGAIPNVVKSVELAAASTALIQFAMIVL